MRVLSLQAPARKKYFIHASGAKSNWTWGNSTSRASSANNQRPRVGGQEFYPSLVARQTVLDYVGQGWLSHVIFPLAVSTAAILECWVTLNGIEYYFRHCQNENPSDPIMNKQSIAAISFNGSGCNINVGSDIPPILAAASMGQAVEITSGLRVEFASSVVQTSTTNNNRALHVIYNVSNTWDYHADAPNFLGDL